MAIPLALIVAMFALADVSQPLRATLAPDAFEGESAALLARELSSGDTAPTPGSDADEALADLVAVRLGSIPGAEITEQRFDGSFEGTKVELRNVIAVLPGSSERQVVLMAGRDVAAGDGASTAIASTAALLEIASGFGGAIHGKSLVFVSTGGASIGALGARRFLGGYSDADLVDAAVVLSQPAAEDPRPPLVVPWSSGPQSTAVQLVESAEAAISSEVDLPPGDPGPLDELLRLALPAGIGEQGPLIEGGVDAVRLSSSGELPPPAGREADEDLSATTLGLFGRATLSLLLALDAAPEPLEHGPAAYIGLAGNLVPGWALSLLALAMIAPLAAASIAGISRDSNRPVEAALATGWALGRALPFVAVLIAAYAMALVGLLPDPEFPVDLRPLSPGLKQGIALVVLGGLLAAALFYLRPLRPPPPAARAIAPAVAVLLACLATLGVWLVNPFLALLIAPGLHAWGLVAARAVESRLGIVALLLAGLVPLAAGVADLGSRLEAGAGIGWDLLLLVIDGHFGLPLVLMGCLLAGCGLALLGCSWSRTRPAKPQIRVRRSPPPGRGETAPGPSPEPPPEPRDERLW